MRLLKKYKITYIKKLRIGGAKVYRCDCGQRFTVPIDKEEVKCLYCGREER